MSPSATNPNRLPTGDRAAPSTSRVQLKSFKAAALAFVPAWGDLDGNVARMAAAIENVAKQGARLAVLPETATAGYLFDAFALVRPYLVTVPGKASAALEKVARAYRIYVAVGIAELDAASGLGYNTAALIGPDGYIGKYRKHGLNPQDQRWASPGNLGFPVFDTEFGRLTMLICYDNTYWQYARLALLHDVDIIAWSSVSDRVMPGTPANLSQGDHSTIANVQYLSFHSGAFVVAATRTGIEENPVTKEKVYYNGGSSVWDPTGRRIAQAPVVPPEMLSPGVHGVIIAEIDPATSAPIRAQLLARRRPELYHLLALHRAPTDAAASRSARTIDVAVQGSDPERLASIAWRPPPKDGLAVLPALFRYGPDRSAADYAHLAEPPDGPSEKLLIDLAAKGGGYVAGSYPERSGDAVYHTVALAASTGKVIARYRATHLPSHGAWAKDGQEFVVAPTTIGRIALALAEELAVPEVFGVYSAERADIVAAPSGRWEGPLLEIAAELFNVPYPAGTPYAPYAAAHLGQFWVAAAGWAASGRPASLLVGPDPVIATPPRIAGPGEILEAKLTAPWAGTWINQQRLIGGQQPGNTVPLVLPHDSACFQTWRKAPGWLAPCW